MSVGLAMIVPVYCITPISTNVAAVYNYGGQEQILVDPVRHVVYWSDLFGDQLCFYNSDNGTLMDSIYIGIQPSSLAISPDNSKLYVSILRDKTIAVVNLDTRAVERNIDFDFEPFSVETTSSGRLYVTAVGEVMVVNETSGKIKTTTPVGYDNLVLELSPDGSTLLVGGVYSGQIFKFSAQGDDLLYIDNYTGGHVGEGIEQFVVDWPNGTIYRAPSWDHTLIEVIDLDTMDRVTRLSSMPYGTRASGICLSPDRRTLYATSAYFYTDVESFLCAINLTDGRITASEIIRPESAILAHSAHDRALFTGLPFNRISLDPEILPLLPTEHSTLSFTPQTIEARIHVGVRNVTLLYANLSLDGHALSCVVLGTRLVGNVTERLDDGTHSIEASWQWNEGPGTRVWTFEVNRSSSATTAPHAEPGYPFPGQVLDDFVYSIAASIDYGTPRMNITGITSELDGIQLAGSLNYYGNWLSNVTFSVDSGLHTATVEVSWGPDSTVTSWNFTIRVPPQGVFPGTPSPGAILESPPTHIDASLDLGWPPIEVTSATIKVGTTTLEATFTSNTTFEIILDSPITQFAHTSDGVYTIVADVYWGDLQHPEHLNHLSTSWTFTYNPPPPELPDGNDSQPEPFQWLTHLNPAGFRIDIPASWQISVNETLDKKVYPLVVYCPVIGGSHGNIIVDTKVAKSVKQSEAYLQTLMESTVESLGTEGVEFVIVEPMKFIESGNTSGVVLVIKWDSPPIKQKIVLMVSEEHKRIWILIFTASESAYSQLDGTFNTMISSFNETLAEDPQRDSALTLGLVGGIALAIALPTALILWLTKKRKQKGPMPD